MAIRIRIKKFINLNYQLNLNLFKDIDDLDNGLSNKYSNYTILEVFYWQVLYKPYIKNQAYRGIINFYNKFTNTRLQEYLQIS